MKKIKIEIDFEAEKCTVHWKKIFDTFDTLNTKSFSYKLTEK